MNSFRQGDFFSISEIGSGGEGSVFRAITKTHGLVAVKVFTYKVNLREIENIRKFSNHPNIIEFYGVYKGTDRLLQHIGYVMKYMARGSIDQVIHTEKLQYKINTAYHWILQAARGIAFLHWNNLIHRDIKPANMLLSDDLRTVKISDFGLAKVNIASSVTSFQGSTYLYQSPEMFKSLTDYTVLTDVFSFAISTWEIITKSVPYSEKPEMKNILILMEKVTKGKRPSLKSINNANIKKLLKKMWHSSETTRPTMNEVVTFLEEKVVKFSDETLINEISTLPRATYSIPPGEGNTNDVSDDEEQFVS